MAHPYSPVLHSLLFTLLLLARPQDSGSQMAGRAAQQVVRKIINTTAAPAAIGPYNQGVLVDNTLYVSGQIGLNPETGQLVTGGVTAETSQVLKNMGEILKAAGSSYNKVIKTTVLLADINDYAAVNSVYSQVFVEKEPARAAFQCAALPKGAKVEIEAIAIVGDITDQ